MTPALATTSRMMMSFCCTSSSPSPASSHLLLGKKFQTKRRTTTTPKAVLTTTTRRRRRRDVNRIDIIRTSAMISSDHAMPMTASSSSSDVAIERVEVLKQRKNSAAAFVFDIADSAAAAMNAPAIEIVQQPSGDELSSSFSSNEFVEDATSTTSAPDVVVQSSIKDAMALIQAEEREAKIASGEIVGAYPFSFFFSSILSRSCFAAQTVDCDLGYTLGAPQSTL